jgi:hypothetical protein
MDIATKRMEPPMLKRLVLAALALTASSAALADHRGERDWDDERYEHRWHRPHRHYYYAPPPVYVVRAPRVVYAPPPPVAYPYYAAPVVVQPAPMYYPAPVYPAAPGISVRFNFPL